MTAVSAAYLLPNSVPLYLHLYNADMTTSEYVNRIRESERFADDTAERILWGNTSHVPGVGNRRMAAVGYSDAHGLMVADSKHPEIDANGYDYIAYHRA